MLTTGLTLQVTDAMEAGRGVRSLTLVGDRPLPSYPPGAHLGIEWAPGRTNAYSLTGDGRGPDAYRVSVALRPDGAGGSRHMHRLVPGDRVRATPPRSSFPPVETAAHHVLVAGGIGVTPVVAHARWHAFWGHSFAVVLIGGAAHAADLRALAGNRLTVAEHRDDGRAAIRSALGSAPWNSHLYLCGPPGLLRDGAAIARERHWVDARIHVEAFTHAPETGAPFTVVLGSSGRRVRVGADETLLDALLRAEVAVPHLCRQGVCGECVTGLRAGRVEHRDTVLSDDERADRIAVCVSRARPGETLELDR